MIQRKKSQVEFINTVTVQSKRNLNKAATDFFKLYTSITLMLLLREPEDFHEFNCTSLPVTLKESLKITFILSVWGRTEHTQL